MFLYPTYPAMRGWSKSVLCSAMPVSSHVSFFVLGVSQCMLSFYGYMLHKKAITLVAASQSTEVAVAVYPYR